MLFECISDARSRPICHMFLGLIASHCDQESSPSTKDKLSQNDHSLELSIKYTKPFSLSFNHSSSTSPYLASWEYQKPASAHYSPGKRLLSYVHFPFPTPLNHSPKTPDHPIPPDQTLAPTCNKKDQTRKTRVSNEKSHTHT